jgi:creatinine amidohydrolase/Fe(II)-dependent formamide hydrolase-like protein
MTQGTHHVRAEDLTWTEFQDRAPQVPYWLIVTGSVEQHGPHLPLGADTMVAERAAELVAQRHGALILPTVRAGVLHAFQDWPGSARLSPTTFTEVVTDLARGIAPYNNRLILLNGHDENHEPLMLAARRLATEQATDVIVVEWAELASDAIRQVSSSTSEAHAGEGLTSVFLHWFPDRVRTDLVAPGVAAQGGLTQDDLHVVKRAHRPVRFARTDVPSGVIGDPSPATAEKGAVICKLLVERLDALAREQGWL